MAQVAIPGKVTLTGNGLIDFAAGGTIDGTLAVTGGKLRLSAWAR